jgi:hypothetical protein
MQANSAAIASTDEVVAALRLCLEDEGGRHGAPALSCIQRLITGQAISRVKPATHSLTLPQDGFIFVAKALRSVLELGDEALNLKVLQVSLSVFQSALLPSCIDVGQKVFIPPPPPPMLQVLEICFALHGDRNSTVSNTAAATIRQSVSILFDRLAVEEHLEGTPHSRRFKFNPLPPSLRGPPPNLERH